MGAWLVSAIVVVGLLLLYSTICLSGRMSNRENGLSLKPKKRNLFKEGIFSAPDVDDGVMNCSPKEEA